MGCRGPKETDRQTEAERETPGKRAQDRGTEGGPYHRLGECGTWGAPPELGCPGSPAVLLACVLYAWLLRVSAVVYELVAATGGIQFPTGETRD